MNKMLVAVFDTETAAFEGKTALLELHRNGDITLYDSAVITKDRTGKISLKQQAERGLVGTAVGLLTGGLIGLLGGPVGLAMGVTIGGLTGAIVDVGRSGTNVEFLDEVSNALTAGKTALVAEVDESWTTPVDARLHKLGATVLRRHRSEVVEDQLMREREALDADLQALNADLKQAASENRAAIQKDIERVKQQIKATQDWAAARLEKAKAETEARVMVLQDQAKATTGRAKERIEKRIADVKSDFEVRSKKLSQAGALIKEAIAA